MRTQSLSNAAGSGRSRSGASSFGVPMWMKPVMRSCSCRPSNSQDLRIVGRPAGQPLRAEPERLRRLQQGEAHARRAGETFGFGDLFVRAEFRDDRHDHRCVREAMAILVDRGIARLRIAFERARRPAPRQARVARRHGCAGTGTARACRDRARARPPAACAATRHRPGRVRTAASRAPSGGNRGQASRSLMAAIGMRVPSQNLQREVDDRYGATMLPTYEGSPRPRAARGSIHGHTVSRHDDHARVPSCTPDAPGLLDELKRIAVEQLGAVPGGLYRPIEDQLQQNLRAGQAAQYPQGPDDRARAAPAQRRPGDALSRTDREQFR